MFSNQNNNNNNSNARECAMLIQKEKEYDRMAKEAEEIPIGTYNDEFIFLELTADELLQKKEAAKILARIDLLDKKVSDMKNDKKKNKNQQQFFS